MAKLLIAPWPLREARFVSLWKKHVGGQELGPQALSAANGLPKTAGAYAFAKGTFHRKDFRAWAISQNSGLFSGINESSVRARNDQIYPAPAKLCEDFLHRIAGLTLLAKICAGSNFFKLNRAITAEQNRTRSLA